MAVDINLERQIICRIFADENAKASHRMGVTLHLNIDKSVWEQTQLIAQEQGKTVSEMIENHFRAMIQSRKQQSQEMPLSPFVRDLMGSIPDAESNLDDINEREIIHAHVEKKHQ
ncbi:DUF6364 family protein [Tannerella forsythia]|uniref:Uncharacterized protein n=1 Tax=Tannerella forsythia TaxID=28112 RepID=A0A3P1Z887_TANFO|nr:DUF6364 family protein [Tannerella forsythia]RRD79349.1 hypothetical protein EII41_00720 [Tannerella forsythia]